MNFILLVIWILFASFVAALLDDKESGHPHNALYFWGIMVGGITVIFF